MLSRLAFFALIVELQLQLKSAKKIQPPQSYSFATIASQSDDGSTRPTDSPRELVIDGRK